jgi:hypothetical protein
MKTMFNFSSKNKKKNKKKKKRRERKNCFIKIIYSYKKTKYVRFGNYYVGNNDCIFVD